MSDRTCMTSRATMLIEHASRHNLACTTACFETHKPAHPAHVSAYGARLAGGACTHTHASTKRVQNAFRNSVSLAAASGAASVALSTARAMARRSEAASSFAPRSGSCTKKEVRFQRTLSTTSTESQYGIKRRQTSACSRTGAFFAMRAASNPRVPQ